MRSAYNLAIDKVVYLGNSESLDTIPNNFFLSISFPSSLSETFLKTRNEQDLSELNWDNSTTWGEEQDN